MTVVHPDNRDRNGAIVHTAPSVNPAPKAKIVLAFLAIYTIWGSTYLFIRFGVETLPPFLMAGGRFLAAGSLMYAWMRWRGSPAPTLAQWRSATIIGALLLLIGNGGVTWAEQMIPSGVTALLISTSPIWFVMLDWIWFGADRPTGKVLAGLSLGLAGVIWLIGPDKILQGGGFAPVGILVLMLATASWAGGSLYSRRASLPSSPFMATAMEMIAGAALLLAASALTGEMWHWDPSTVSLKSLLSVIYLAIFGSLIGFTAYVWLLRVVSPARVSTYAFVNPVIAVFLGWTLGGEEFSVRMGFAALVILVGVVLIVMRPTPHNT
jgi:drug/metabolite transporter (DMT)-like permease